MTDATPHSPDRELPRPRTVVKVGMDFVFGVALFSMVLGSVSSGNGQAVAGAAGWVTTVSPQPVHGWLDQVWSAACIGANLVDRNAALAVLALSFGAMTAFNLSIARHLRATAVLQRG